MLQTNTMNPVRPDPESTTIITGDGVPLSVRIFEPGGRAKATVLFTGGVGVPQRVYRELAGWLAQRGVRCLTFDYRGFGESRHSARGVATASLSTWARIDAVAAFEYCEAAWDEPVALLAHSFGGQLLALAEPLHRATSAVLVASQCGSARYWDGVQRLKVAALWHVLLPVGTALGETTPRWLGFRVPRGVADEWGRWGRHRDWLFSLNHDAESRLRRFRGPLLSFSVIDDDLAPPRAVAALLRRFDPAVVRERRLEPVAFGVDGIGHYGVFRRGPIEPVWNEIHDFLIRGISGV